MDRFKVLLFTVLASLVLLSGCGAEYSGKKVEQLRISGGGKAEAMVAAEMVLGKMGFAISKSDFESGYITTRPLRTGQFFEFWRSDAVGEFNSAESNLHCIRRTVVIDVTKEAEQLYVDCDVSVERLSLSEAPLGSRSEAYDKFPQSSRLERSGLESIERDLRESRGAEWIDLGGDPELAEVILTQIEEKIKG
ncbi:MAG: hypothetical protein MUO22_10030 [Sedimentisphaerales bacterium]|nr:hypothetical protein [Sedimentisphaerales bacterium]